MVPELGTFAIILALCFALIQSIAPWWRNDYCMELGFFPSSNHCHWPIHFFTFCHVMLDHLFSQ